MIDLKYIMEAFNKREFDIPHEIMDKEHGSTAGTQSVREAEEGSTLEVSSDEYPFSTRYELGVTIGDGNFGKVKWAFDRKVNGAVALKIIYSRKPGYQQAKQVFLHEVNPKVFSMNHPNVIKFLEYSQRPIIWKKNSGPTEAMYIAMEFAEGGTLFNLVKAE